MKWSETENSFWNYTAVMRPSKLLRHTITQYWHTSWGNNKVVSRICTRTIYWIFTLLGLSLPYRWFVFFTVGHVDFRIKKRVFKPDVLQVTTSPLLLPLIPTAAMDSSLMHFQTPSPPPSPAPSSLPQSTPPPDYNTACSLLFQDKFEKESHSEPWTGNPFHVCFESMNSFFTTSTDMALNDSLC